jgi:hypothetical protein
MPEDELRDPLAESHHGLNRPSAIYTDANLPSFNPSPLERTPMTGYF